MKNENAPVPQMPSDQNTSEAVDALKKEIRELKTRLERNRKAYDVSIINTRKAAINMAIEKYKSS